MAKTVAYFYDPDVGNFHYGEGARPYARGFGTRRFEAGAKTPATGTDELSSPTPRGRAPYEAPSLGIDP